MLGAARYDEYIRTMDLMQAIVDVDESTTVGDIQCQLEALAPLSCGNVAAS